MESELRSSFPWDGTLEEQFRCLLQYATRAPSELNTQPWRFELLDGTLNLVADTTRSLAIRDPELRSLHMSCGASLLHLRLAMRRFGFQDAYELFPARKEPFWVARVRLVTGDPPTDQERCLFQAIPHRRTRRRPFRDIPLDPEIVPRLSSVAEEEGAWLHRVASDRDREIVAGLVAEVDRLHWANPSYRAELSNWLRDGSRARRDGIPAHMSEAADLFAYLGAYMSRYVDLGPEIAAHDAGKVLSAPELVVLCTRDDSRSNWVAAGQALARMLLTAHTLDVSAAYLNQAVQVPEFRAQLQQLLALDGYPQLVLALGHGSERGTSARRAIEEFLGHEG